MNRTLEQRLSALDLPAPGGLVQRALVGCTARAGPRWPAPWRASVARATAVSVLVALLFVAANSVAVRLDQGYRQLFAQTPGIGDLPAPLLSLTGLTGADVTPSSGSARAAGHEIRLLGVYADGTRTVVLVDVDGGGLFDPASPARSSGPVVEVAELVDSHGRAYQSRPYVIPGGHSVPIPFEAVADARPGDRVRLTLHVTRLMIEPDGQAIDASWKIPFWVTIARSMDLPLPRPAEVDGNRFTFTAATLSGRLLTLRWEVTGPTVERIRSRAYPPTTPGDQLDIEHLRVLARSLAVTVERPTDGASTVVMVLSGSVFPRVGPATGEAVVVVPEPGEYELLLIGRALPIATLLIP